MTESILEKYSVTVDNVTGEVEIKRVPDELVPIYFLKLPKIEPGTLAILDKIRENLVTRISIKSAELLDISAVEDLKHRFYSFGLESIKKELPSLPNATQELLIGLLIQEMLGLGKIEMLLADGELEEVVINSATEPVWAYHKKHGWLKTNITVNNESETFNYAASIGRKIGRQITTLNPLLDAHIPSGDRVNATLFPISTKGNTMTIRKFRRKPWTITDLIEYRTVSPEVAALIWLAIQYELNIIVSGGTASGKTSFLNVFMSFIQPNHRIISIEQTREIQLPSFLHWVPMTTREPNPEGKGEVSMLDLLVNSLRMRPDRIIVGEIRTAEEAEVLFEAMHTGHSVYATLHADTAEQTYKRMVNPPINIPETMMESLNLIAVCFRDRRQGIRRVLQIAELIPGDEKGLKTNILFRWKPTKDEIVKQAESYRVFNDLRLHTGMSDKEIQSDMDEKKKVLEWIVKHKVNTVDAVGRVVSEYYTNRENILKIVGNDDRPEKIIPPEILKG
ncbi:MAG TPA: type II/IV secretion system ATPase subunit [archaeon]|nr:type II/IV secretion system ATPase subunit [archaeon]